MRQLGRLEDHEPRPVRHLSDGRGRGAAADVPGNSAADRPAAGATSASVIGKWARIRQTETAEVRLDQGRTARSSASARSTARFGVYCARSARLLLPKEAQGPDHGLYTLGNPGNVGRIV